MLRGLRWRLTAVYLLAAMALVAVVSAGAYGLLQNYLQATTDLALQRKVALGFHDLNAPLPTSLAEADREWTASRPAAPTARPISVGEEHDDEGGQPEDYAGPGGVYDTDLAPIFLLAVNEEGQIVQLPGMSAGIAANPDAARSAFAHGVDWRTVVSADGTRVRLLTYRLGGDERLLLQAGRSLADQDRLLQQLLLGLLAIGGISVVGLGAASWWLAGRSLAPAQQAWERQQAFVANASHELRTPLTLMRATAEVAGRGLPAEDRERRELLADLLRECDHMTDLVNDSLLLSRLDAGQVRLEPKAVALADLLGDVQRQIGRLADERGVRLTIGESAGSVHADATRLRQVMLIVLDNALRYTPRGGEIRIETALRGRQAQITVGDSGPGIAPEHLPRIFDRFYRVDSARGRESGGAGLGLAIARSLVEAQHGQIRVESQVGRGTRVTLSLPLH